MIDSALSWGRVDSWILENYPKMLRNAMTRRVERSIDHLIVGMLRDVPGWSPAENITFLKHPYRPRPDHPDGDDAPEPTPLLVQAAQRLAAVLQNDDTETNHLETAFDFWQAALNDKTKKDLRGFACFASVTKMNDSVWEELTLETLKETNGKQIDRDLDIVERTAAAKPVTTTGLKMFDLLVRSPALSWRQSRVCEVIIEATRDMAPSPELDRLRDALRERGFETT